MKQRKDNELMAEGNKGIGLYLARHKAKDLLDRYADKHELDVSQENEPSDKDKVLSADPGFAEFLDSLDDKNCPF